jgi:hypothetical protein
MMKATANGKAGTVVREAEEYKRLHGQYVAIYGPNYIWTGLLVGETENVIHLQDCQQVYETREHSAANADREPCSELMLFPKSAVCNIGATKWAQP